jgi:hypothetical protein
VIEKYPKYVKLIQSLIFLGLYPQFKTDLPHKYQGNHK